MKATLYTLILFVILIIASSFNPLENNPTPNDNFDLSGPCDCEKGWNFTVHQITPNGCREKSIYCVDGVKLEPGYSCGTCPKPCSTCEEDDNGKITICKIYNNGNTSQFKAECGDLQNLFKEDGSFVGKNDHCGPCTCADSGDVDSDGDGVCDTKDECPQNADRTEAGPCGCDDQDTDGDGVCDKDDKNPGVDDNIKTCDISGNNTFEWIEEVTINDFLNKSGDNNQGYGDYSQSPIILTSGDSLKIWITAGYTDNICELSHAVFIDWNQDYDFNDNGEMVLNERNIGETGINLAIPKNIATGKYAMRVIVDLGRVYAPCGGCIDGEAEDYVIEVVESSCPEIYEGFGYSADQDISGLNGGKSWQNGWSITTEGDAKATVINQSLMYENYLHTGNKLGVLNAPGSRLTMTRNIGSPVIQSDNIIWMSYLYTHDDHSVFSSTLSGSGLGFYVDRNGYLVIGGLKGVRLEKDATYQFLVKVDLQTAADEISLWINPDKDGGSLYTQVYNAPVADELMSVGFEFWTAGTNSRKSGQYLDEIRLGCTHEEVLPIDSDISIISSSDVDVVELTISPNPAHSGDVIEIDLSSSLQLVNTVIIVDSSGRLMYENVLYAGNNKIDIPRLESGVYIVEVKNEMGTVREQIIIQNE